MLKLAVNHLSWVTTLREKRVVACCRGKVNRITLKWNLEEHERAVGLCEAINGTVSQLTPTVGPHVTAQRLLNQLSHQMAFRSAPFLLRIGAANVRGGVILPFDPLLPFKPPSPILLSEAF